MNKKYLGVDIGGTAVKLGLFDNDGKLLEKWQIPTRLENRGGLILPDLTVSAEKHMKARNLSFADIYGIGAAVPGPVQDGGYVPLAVNLGWKELDAVAEIRALTGIERIVVENDAKAAALGEYWMGGWEQYSSMVMITLGTAVGGAVIMNGRIVPGAFGAAGELSHIPVNPGETELCACGKCGHLQQYVSAEGIVRNYRKNAGLSAISDITVKNIFDAAREGLDAALKTVRETVRYLAGAMAGVSCVIDPALYIIGGGISKAGEFLLEMLREEFKKQALPTAANVRIEAAKTGSDAGIYGACRCIFMNFSD
ncbi:MAG: ROK family protein [Anaerolineaceae bacterium]|nr:ROK family protein [Anaerolineaceae bacterium]